jgi:hypothetical protein
MSSELQGKWSIVFHFEVYNIIYNRSLLHLTVHCKYKSIADWGNQDRKKEGKLKLPL